MEGMHITMFKNILKGIAILLGIVVLLFGVLFALMSIANSPGYAWRVLRYGESDTQDFRIFPERMISNGTQVSPLPRGDQPTPYQVEYPYQDGTRTEVLDDLLQRTDTRAFLIVKDDRLIFETYLESSRQEINTSFSAAKSFDFGLDRRGHCGWQDWLAQ